MLKKQIQKLLLKTSRPVLIGLTIAAILVANFGYFAASFISAQPTQAQVDCNAFDPTAPKTYASRIYVDKSAAPADRSYAIGAANVTGPDTQEISLNEELNVYAEVTLPAAFTECATTANLDSAFKFEVYNAAGKIIDGLSTIAKISKAGDQVKFYSEGMKNSNWSQYSIRDSSAPLPAYVYFCRNSGCSITDLNNNDYIEKFNIKINPNPATPAVVQPPSSALLSGSGSSSDPNAKKKAEDITFRFRQDASQGLRSKYRVLLDEKAPFDKLIFGQNGLEKVYVDWANDASKLAQSNQLEISIKNSQLTAVVNPYFRNVVLGFNYFETKIENNGCQSGYFTEDCSKVIFSKAFDSANGKESKEQGVIPTGFDPVLYNAAWKSKVQDKAVGEGQPLGTVEFRAIPIIWAQGVQLTNPNAWYSYVYASQAVKFTVEVYKTEADIKKACENDASVTDKTICSDPQKMRYQVGEVVDVTTGTNQKSGSVTQSLYDFIIRVIAQIVLWLTTLIYKIFAYFVVPVLNALLQVRPYQDAFVNIIYPGWLILRNMANIFFIISLLVVGLRILFQQSAAATARGFIMRLIIMALLVNFSLVIAQGIVGIADTVQSQFMPQNTRIIEALGQKLMVEPIQSFRVAVSEDGTDSGMLKGDQTIADTAKPIVLLVLAIAAFFSFVAIAAFLAIRLVALLVLYMVSPIAYVGYVMDDTKKYAAQWWSEFIKYAFLTPILVFFLNIAALVATVFSGKDGNVIKLQDNLSGDLVAGGLTIATHFIVLLFIFAGMKYAQSSGTIGSKAIVDYAKKGFDALTTRPAKWAAGAAADAAKGAAKDQYIRRIKDGLLDPLAWRNAYKKNIEEKNKRMHGNRIMNKSKFLSPAGILEDPTQAMRYLWHRGSVGSTHALTDAAGKYDDESKILTAEEASRLRLQRNATEGQSLALSQVAGRLGQASPLATADGISLLSDLSNEMLRLETEKNATVTGLQAQAVTANVSGNLEAGQSKLAEAAAIEADYNKKVDDIQEMRDRLEPVVTAAVNNASATLTMDDHLKQDLADKLDKDIEDLGKELKVMAARQDDDATRRQAFGYAITDQMDLEKRRNLEKKKDALEKLAGERAAPESSLARQVRREREDEEAKKIEATDDIEELIAQYNIALKKNNLPLASAISKKLAKEGGFKDLLKEHGYRNNTQSMVEMIDKHFKKYAPQIRMQLMSEVGTLNSKNGNMAASRGTTIDKNSGRLRKTTSAEFDKYYGPKLRKKSLSDLKKMKTSDIGQEGPDGRLTLLKGAPELIKKLKTVNITTPSVLDSYRRDMGPLAREILKAPNVHLVNDAQAMAVLNAIAQG